MQRIRHQRSQSFLEVEDAEEGAVRKNPLVTNLSEFQSQETRAKLAAMMRVVSGRWQIQLVIIFLCLHPLLHVSVQQATARTPTSGNAQWSAVLWWNNCVGLVASSALQTWSGTST